MNTEWKIEVLNQHSELSVKKENVTKYLRQGLRDAAKIKKISNNVNELSVVFTDDKEIKRLNKIFRQKNKPTDVLSFSQLEGGDEIDVTGTSLGDIVISLDTAIKQAVKYKVTQEQEVLRLLIHGLLHLLGYDHVDVPEAEAEKMRAQETLLFDQYNNSWRKPWIVSK